MSIENSFRGIGNLTRDPEVRFLANERAVASFGLAVTKKYKTAAGEQKEDVCFLDCEAWGKLAEIIGQYLVKGKQIAIEGSLKLDTWDDKASGAKRSKIKVVVDQMKMLGTRATGEQGPQSSAINEVHQSAPVGASNMDDEPPF